MNKINVFFPCLFFCYLSCFSQNYIQIDYSVIENNNDNTYNLIIGDTLSSWTMNNTISNSNFDLTENIDFFFYKQKKEGMVYDKGSIVTKVVYVKDTIHSMQWEMTGQTKKILGYNCNGAKTSFRGRNYIAFFAMDLPYNDGPWKFGGLPGLILEVNSTDGYVKFRANKIKHLRSYKFKFNETVKNKTFLSWQEYVNYNKKFFNNYINFVRTSEGTSLGSEINIKINSKEIIYPKIQSENGYTIGKD